MAFRLGGGRSIQLSYGGILYLVFYYPSLSLSTRNGAENREKYGKVLAIRRAKAYNNKVSEFILPKRKGFFL